jgi:hypothetical protein
MPVRTLTHNGITLTIAQWAKRNNLGAQTLRHRLDAGWPIEQALFRQPHNGGDIAGFKPGRAEQSLQVRTVKLRREFTKLVFELDNALRTFRQKLDALLPDERTGGRSDLPEDSPSDRTIPTAQDSL